MINNAREYRISYDWLIRFSEDLERLENMPEEQDVSPLLRKAQIESCRSIIADLEGQIKDYSDRCRLATSLDALPKVIEFDE